MSSLLLIVVAPLLCAALTAAVGKERSLAVVISVLGSLFGLVVTIAAVAAPVRQTLLPETQRLIPGPAFGSIDLPLSIALTPATGAIAVTVALVLLAVQLVSGWYLAGDERRVGFHATVSLFGAAMLVLVLSTDLVLTIVGWEVMGWCSWLLIGHHSHKLAARQAARKAFLVTRGADIFLISGAAALIAQAGTSSFEGIAQAITSGSLGVSLAMVGIVIGVLGKSAQLPFSDWLPDAMAGPTPASALIHAATMVAAGTLVLASLGSVLALSAPAKVLLLVSVCLTMVLGAAMAFAQSDLKRLLAWSTVSQIALMLAPLALLSTTASGDEPVGAAQFHLYAHALFKALLFLTLAWLSVIGAGTSAQALRGSGRAHRLAAVAWIVGLINLTGFPFVVGGLSKEHLFEVATHQGGAAGWILAAVLALTTVLTAAYCARAFVIVLALPLTKATTRSALPVALSAALGALTLGSIAGGLIVLSGRFAGVGFSWLMLAITTPLVILGLWIGARLTWAVPTSWQNLADSGLGVDRYFRRAGASVLALARVTATADQRLLGAPVRAIETGLPALSARGQNWQGDYRPSTGVLAVGAAALLLVIVVGILTGALPIVMGALT